MRVDKVDFVFELVDTSEELVEDSEFTTGPDCTFGWGGCALQHSGPKRLSSILKIQ